MAIDFKRQSDKLFYNNKCREKADERIEEGEKNTHQIAFSNIDSVTDCFSLLAPLENRVNDDDDDASAELGDTWALFVDFSISINFPAQTRMHTHSFAIDRVSYVASFFRIAIDFFHYFLVHCCLMWLIWLRSLRDFISVGYLQIQDEKNTTKLVKFFIFYFWNKMPTKSTENWAYVRTK